MSDFLINLLGQPVTVVSLIVGVVVLALGVAYAVASPRQFMLVLKSIMRNKMRTGITCAATVVLVCIITMIWTVVYVIDVVTTEKARDLKLIITERWQVPSQMPMTHAKYLDPQSSYFILDQKDVGPKDFMTWSFYGGYITKDKSEWTISKLAFFFVMNPNHIMPMMDNMEDLDPTLVDKLAAKRQGCLMGHAHMATLNKKVGERFTVTSITHKDIDLEFEIVGELPDLWEQSAIMNEKYFHEALDHYKTSHNGTPHELDNRRLNLVWLRVPDRETFNKVGGIIENSPVFGDRPVRVDTASSAIGAFLDAYRDILWGAKVIMVPAILIMMSLVVANAISISVRERRTEMAVLKVLGFRPNQILRLVLGESLLVGGVGGLLAATFSYLLVNKVMGGIKFPIGFFPVFFVPAEAIIWGFAMGVGSSFLGSFLPSWNARAVKVSEVFSKVA